ncbi:MAG: hypothetical protein KAR47_19310, partial [Planctomycetes bacterium]|nr:hypothetical protein [Planctomycetota bacterium]
VEYYFTCTAGGGNDSGWQPGATYEDTGLSNLTVYTYTVKARDLSVYFNETGESGGQSAMTEDSTAPAPDPATWAVEPFAIGFTSISMTATTATDVSGVEYYFANITDPNHDSGWQDSAAYLNTGLPQRTKYTYTVTARDKSPNQNTTAASAAKSATTQDGTAPTPDPMTWAVEPYAAGSTSISMTATTASDPNGVEYYFTNVTDPAHHSGWQNSPVYLDSGLAQRTSYTYTVTARDKSVNLNETTASVARSATTLDGTPPDPDPMTWATEPYALGTSSISMTATLATDPNGVEYYFTCTAGGGNDSGWQPGVNYTDTGLDDLTAYTYTVKARDLSSNFNETAPSVARSALTEDGTAPLPDPMTWAAVPYATGSTSLAMTATTATDLSGVEYYFACSSPGGHDSGWQLSSTYIDFGLTELTTYEYTVQARDRSGNLNATGISTPQSATTEDGSAPVPNPMSWLTEPFVSDTHSISMTATTASDPSGVEYYFTCTTGGGNNSGWQSSSTYVDSGLTELVTYEYTVKARDKSLNLIETIDSVARGATVPDSTAPNPDPMTWAVNPTAIGPTSIAMTATTASDPSGFEYYFTCTAGGGNNSGWQPSPTYVDSGLSEITTYTYTVSARDLSPNQNRTAESAALSATTEDGTKPTPNPMTWAIVPHATSTTSISMTATTASDASGVEYFFACSTPGGHDSGWQLSATYEDTGLTEVTTYTYKVMARDLSSNQNETGFSPERSATTDDVTPPNPDPMTWSVEPYATGPTSISMTATIATDPSGVEYYFTNITDPNHDSGWLNSNVYVDGGLSQMTTYTYMVTARDKSSYRNPTASSVARSATTEDGSAPTPDPMTWSVEPYADSPTSISMTATTASDPNGVEYYFANVTDPTHDSGWISSTVYVDTGLAERTEYTYTVSARDKSPNQNETTPSDPASATTQDGTAPTPDPM